MNDAADPPDSSTGPDTGRYALLDRLAAEFAARHRIGERPNIEEYVAQFPELADEIRELFPAMVQIELADVEEQESCRRDRPAQAARPPAQVGDFRIIREIGRGGMGVVYEAEQVSLNRRVALKALLRGSVSDERSEERFRREARAAARLHHTNIVPVFEIGQEGDVAYYAMQFIEGQGLDVVIGELRRLRERSHGGLPASASPAVPSIRPHGGRANAIGPTLEATLEGADGQLSRIAEIIRTGRISEVRARTEGSCAIAGTDGPKNLAVRAEKAVTLPDAASSSGAAGPTSSQSASLPGGTPISSVEGPGRRMTLYRSVAQIGRQAAEALAHAHARGIVHRDIKPANLLLDTAGVVWITDFGLAKAEEGGLTHTGDILGTLRYMAPERFRAEGDLRVDIYALGLTLYELLALQPAFNEADRPRLIESIREQEPARPRSIDPRIPRDLETIVLKAIEKEPRLRYGSAAALADDLRRFHDGEPIRARPVTPAERVVKWARRRPIPATLSVLSVLLATVIITIGSYSYIKIRWALGVARSEQAKAKASERDAITAGRKADEAAVEARRQAALSTAQTAQAYADAGQVERGLFGLLDALALAPVHTDDDRGLRMALGRNVEAWTRAAPILRGLYDEVDGCDFVGTDGRILALFNGSRLRLVDLVDGRELGPPGGETFPSRLMAVSPDGRLVLAGEESDEHISLYDRASRGLVARFPRSGLWWILNSPCLFADDGRFLIAPSGGQRSINLQCWRIAGQVATAAPARRLPAMRQVVDFPSIFLPGPGGHTVLAELPLASLEGGGEDRIRFRDLDDGREPAGVQLTPGAFGGGWAFDGTALITASAEGLVRWWNPATGRPAQPPWWPSRAAVSALLLDAGRILIVGCDDRRVRWFDTRLRQECAPAAWLPMESIHGLRIAPGGAFLASKWGHTVGVWQFPGPLRADSSDAAESVRKTYDDLAFRPDMGAFLLAVPPGDGLRLNWPNPIRSRVDQLRRLAVAGGEFDAGTGRPIGPPLYPWMRHAVYSPDGRLIAAARSGSLRRELQQFMLIGVWEATTGRSVMPLQSLGSFVHSIAFAPDGKTLAVGIVSGFVLFDVSTGRFLGCAEQNGPISRLVFRPDGGALAAGARAGWPGAKPGVGLWDPTTMRPIGSLLACKTLPILRFDGEGHLVVLDVESRRLTRVDGRTGVPLAQSTMLEPTLLAKDRLTIDDREAPRGWKVAYPSAAVAFRSDGKVLAEASDDAVVRQWDVSTGRPIGLALVHSVPIMALAYAPDGGTLAVGTIDGAVRLWDTPTGRLLGPALMHGGPLLALGFAPNGSKLIVVSRDGMSYNWPVPIAADVDQLNRLRDRVEATIGLRRREDGTIAGLSAEGWQSRRDRLASEASVDPKDATVTEMLVAWHRGRARELDRLGRADVAERHRLALQELGTADWLLTARRAASLATHGRFEDADAEYAQIRDAANRDTVVDWYWRQACDQFDAAPDRPPTDPAKVALAIWYLNKVIAGRPTDWRPWLHRSELFDSQGRDALREFDEDSALARGAGPLLAFEFAVTAIVHGNEARAERLVAEISEALDHRGGDSVDAVDVFRGRLLVHFGDWVRYAQLCRHALDDRSPASTLATLQTADLCKEGPVPREIAERLVKRLRPIGGKLTGRMRHLAENRLGAMLYRAGRADEAVHVLEDVLRRESQPLADDLLFLAMAHEHRGDHDLALQQLARFEALYSSLATRMNFWDKLSADDVYREATSKVRLDPAFPDWPFTER